MTETDESACLYISFSYNFFFGSVKTPIDTLIHPYITNHMHAYNPFPTTIYTADSKKDEYDTLNWFSVSIVAF